MRLSDIFTHALFRNSLTYITSNVIYFAVPFFLLPVLTRYLSPADYGIVATFQVLLTCAMMFVGLDSVGAAGVNFFKIKREEIAVYTGNVIYILLATCFILLGAVYFLGDRIASVAKFPASWLVIVVFAALLQHSFSLMLTLWQAQQKTMLYSMMVIIQAFINAVLSIIFVVWLKWGWQGRILGIFLSMMLFACVGIVLLYRQCLLKFSFKKEYVKDALSFGIPLLPHAAGGWAMNSVNRILLNSMVGIAATGLYSTGYQMGMVVSFVTTAFNRAWSPFLYSRLVNDDHAVKVKIVKCTYFYWAGLGLFALFFSASVPFFLKFFVGKDFYPAHRYVFWVALAYVADGMYCTAAQYIFFAKKTYLLSRATIVSAVISVVLNYFFIRRSGAIGAAQATTLSFFIYFIIVWRLSARAYPMPWFSFFRTHTHGNFSH